MSHPGTFSDLLDFITQRMKMSHIYQPLMIRSLVEAGGSATLRQLAYSFLSQDESQLAYYEDRIKNMPLKVLSRHGIVKKEGELVTLNVEKLSFQQKAEIKMACERKLQTFISKKGLGIWDYRMLETDPLPDSLRYRVLKDSGGRCGLCGATKNERPLDVDHIVPRSRGGRTEYSNLQVLCSKCNRSKGNKDQTDFRQEISDEIPDCPFCYSNLTDRIVHENDSCVAIKDKYPVSTGHHLIIPKRHVPDFFMLTANERRDSHQLIKVIHDSVLESDDSVTGYNIGVNCGHSAGQTIFHVHVHYIPRRDGDTEDPRGGIRGAIPDQMHY